MGDPTVRPAWYAVRARTTGRARRAREWTTVLHPPYTAWHLSYVLVGAGVAPHLRLERLLATLLAFALAVGVAAHGFDELRGRPLGTTIPARTLATVSAVSLGGAIALGIVGTARVGAALAAFILVGAVLVLAYNLELVGGRLHNDATFALAWGSFPVLTAYFAQTGSLSFTAVLAAAYAYGVSRAQRHLSKEARQVRRHAENVTGEKTYRDGSSEPITRDTILRPIERALVALSWSTCAIGIALVVR
jgi:spore coat protein U-like protein